MLGRFLQPDAASRIGTLRLDAMVKARALEVVENGYTVIPEAVPPHACADMIARFRRFERQYHDVFQENRDDLGHYPRIVNLHNVMPDLIRLFTRNPLLLATLDALFGAPASLYTSLFYEVGSQQPLHRDTPVFSTRPEYLYFGTTVYLEVADDENGCLEVLERGHLLPEPDREALALRRFGALTNIPSFDQDAWNEYQDTVVGEGRSKGLPTRRLHVNAGDTVIWHPQLPHGGSPIRDTSRTRFSLVMHVTPENVPVYHQNVFFAPSCPFPETPSWGYYEVEGRKIADQRVGISFGHVRNYEMERFSVELANAG